MPTPAVTPPITSAPRAPIPPPATSDLSAPASTELIAVAPRGELGTLRRANSHERRPVTQLRQADVLGRDAAPRITKQLLGRLDRLPAVLERREIPSLAVRAHDPQPSLRGVEREPLSDREGLERLVAPSGLLQNRQVAYIAASSLCRAKGVSVRGRAGLVPFIRGRGPFATSTMMSRM